MRTPPFPLVDIFGILPPRRTFAEVNEILTGRKPSVPGQSPWGFPVFRPTTGPTTGIASQGFRFFSGIAGGSTPRGPLGPVVGQPTP